MSTQLPTNLVPTRFQGGYTVIPIDYLNHVQAALTAWQPDALVYPVAKLQDLIAQTLAMKMNVYAAAGKIQVPIDVVYQICNAFDIWQNQATLPNRYKSLKGTSDDIKDNYTVAFVNPSKVILYK